MKKTLSIILASVIIISSLVVFALPVLAEEAEYVFGEWDVKMLETAKNDKKHIPLSGYLYNEKGFHTYPNSSRFEYWGAGRRAFTVVSREKFDIKNFSMTIVVHDFPTKSGYAGYQWLSFSVWSESNGMAQGDTSGQYGDGWTSLIRYGADGIVNRFESWKQTIGRSGKQQFTYIDGTQNAPVVFEPIIDEETGDFTITFAITDGVVTVNGTPIGSETDECIAKRFEDGYAYVAVTLSDYDDTGHSCSSSISIIDVNGKVPYGDDSKYAESLPDMPAAEAFQYVWCVGTKALLMNNSENCKVYVTADKSFRVNSSEKEFSMNFMPDDDTKWLSDREYHSHVVVLAKNLCTCDSNGADASQHTLSSACSISSICNCQDHELIETERYCVTPVDENGNHIGTDCYSLFVYEACDELRNIDFDSISLSFTNDSDSDVSFEIVAIGYTQKMRLIAERLSWMNLNGSVIAVPEPPEDDIGCDHFDFDEDGLCDICYEIFTTEETTVEETTVEDTTIEETSVEETTVEETTVEETTVEETTVEETTVEETTVEETTIEETTIEETTVEETTVEETTVEEPTVEETTVVETTIEVTTAEITTIEETSIEETTVTQETSPYDWDLDNDGYCDHCSKPYLPTEETTVEVTTEEEPTTEATTVTETTSVETTALETTDEVTTAEETTVAETSAEETTTAETTAKETEAKEPESLESQEAVTSDTSSKSSGCKSSASIGIISIVAIIGSTALIKKKED